MRPNTSQQTVNGAQKVMLACIKAYQFLLSPWLGGQCRFYPSCSYYAQEAIQQHGAIKGLLLGSWRILKCHPFHAGGYDPVPEKVKKNS